MKSSILNNEAYKVGFKISVHSLSGQLFSKTTLLICANVWASIVFAVVLPAILIHSVVNARSVSTSVSNPKANL